MFKSQYNEIKKYRKRRQGILTIRNMVLASTIVLFSTSIGYAYWNTTLKIRGTVTAIGDFSGGGTQTTDAYDPDNPKEGTYTYTTSPGKPTVTEENGVVKEYTFTDTSGYNTASAGIDTGFVPFEGGKNFEMNLKAYFPTSNKSNNAILIDIRKNSSNNLIQIAYTSSSQKPRLILKHGSKNTNEEKALNLDSDQNIEIYISYIDGYLTIINNGTTVISGSYAMSLEDMSILLGYGLNTSGNVMRKANATIYEFSVKEL